MLDKDKIGVAVITCNREEMVTNLLDSMDRSKFGPAVIINDGRALENYRITSHYTYLQTGGAGVGKAKNAAMQYLLDEGAEYIFIIEDDMLILDNDIFERYIEVSRKTGIEHMMFGYHGPANKAGVSGGPPVPKYVIDYNDNIKININHHCVGAFCFYTARGLNEVGMFDENYINAFEHVDHSYKLAKKGYSTPYWNWADISDSVNYIEEQACSEDNSSIRPRSDWKSNIKEAWNYFIDVNGTDPVSVPDIPLDKLKTLLKSIYENKSR
jgi:GT2 family glycosyltransferase